MPVNTARVTAETPAGGPSPVTGFGYLDSVLDQPGSVIAMAHRGGALHPEIPGTENTLHAFAHAVALGYHYLETDVHATSDGVLLAFHDAVLDRVTDSQGELSRLTADEVRGARIAGEHAVPTMAELLEAFPDVPLQHRHQVGVRGAAPGRAASTAPEATTASASAPSPSAGWTPSGGPPAAGWPPRRLPAEVAAFMALPSGRAARWATRGRVAALQVPHRRGRLPIVTRSLVRRAHAAGAHVHVWTVDEPAEMDELLDLGVDGLITDRTDVLKQVLTRRGQWRDHP